MRPRGPRVNCTVPAERAKIVSSLPIPTPSPGLKRVPRWRTMISPPVTLSPANTLTPRRLAFESRPLRLEPRPFLCAIGLLRLGGCRLHGSGLGVGCGLCFGCRLGFGCGLGFGCRLGFGRGLGCGLALAGRRPLGRASQRRDLDARELLTVAGAPLVAPLGLELHDPELGTALVRDDLQIGRA